jgi:hypothetical protein
MHVLETEPKVKKSIVKQYPDGRTLSLLVDEKLVERALLFVGIGTSTWFKEEKKVNQSTSSVGQTED